MNEFKIKSKYGYINIVEGKTLTNIKAIILHIHGIGSHFQFIYPNLDDLNIRDQFFSSHNLKSIGMEFHGHGKSDGTRCFINNFNDLLCDLDVTLDYINNKYPNKKIYILAESMGGAVILKYLIDQFNIKNIGLINGVILLSPMCGIDEHLKPGPIMTSLLLNLSSVFPKLKFAFTTKKMGIQTAINQDFINAKESCPYNYHSAQRLGTVRELYKISLSIGEQMNKINKPILLFHGLNDKITTPIGSKKAFENIMYTDKELIILPNSEHCLLVPNNSDDLTPNFIYAKIFDWINSRIIN
jgi:acylglycerol lipase